MTVTCRQLAEMLLDYVGGELAAEACDGVKVHLEKCPPCGVLVETYRVTIQVTRKLPPRPLPEGLRERLKKALGEAGCSG